MARQRFQRFYSSTRTRMVSCRTYILRMKIGALRLEKSNSSFEATVDFERTRTLIRHRRIAPMARYSL